MLCPILGDQLQVNPAAAKLPAGPATSAAARAARAAADASVSAAKASARAFIIAWNINRFDCWSF